MFETLKHVPKTQKHCFVFEDNNYLQKQKNVTIIVTFLLTRPFGKEILSS